MDTSYDTLLQAFLTLYQESSNIKGATIIKIERQIFTFIVNDIFKKPLPKSVYYVASTLVYVSIKKKLCIEVVMYFLKC